MNGPDFLNLKDITAKKKCKIYALIFQEDRWFSPYTGKGLWVLSPASLQFTQKIFIR